MGKLATLVSIEGTTVEEMIEETTFDSVTYGICVNRGCDFTCQVEPDQSEGYCENCNTNTVKSSLVLAGII